MCMRTLCCNDEWCSASHHEVGHVEVDDGIDDQSSSFGNRAQREAEYELEDIELTTAGVGAREGLEGGFISFDQHALMLSTMFARSMFVRKVHFVHTLINRYWCVLCNIEKACSIADT
jgi:hypothetical protein